MGLNLPLRIIPIYEKDMIVAIKQQSSPMLVEGFEFHQD